MFRWGVLSTAKIGREQVIPALCDAENGIVQAVASRDHSKARAIADRFGAPHAFDSYDTLLASDDVDGVYIPLPTSQHAVWCERAAQAGKHVLCEKPIGMNAGEIDHLITVREETGLLIAEAFMVAYHPQWEKVHDLLENGAIGRLRRVDGAFSYFNSDPSNMRNQPELGGGGLRDIGVYPTVTTRLATGLEPIRLRAEIAISPDFGTDEYASVTAEFDGFELSFYCSTQMALRQSMIFAGETGWIEVRAPFNPDGYAQAEVVLHSQKRERQELFRFPDARQYKRQAEAFAAKASGGGADVFSLENSRGNQAVIDAIFAAGETGGWMSL